MAKYFVYEGMQFKTIAVGSISSQAVDLLSVITAIGTTIIADDATMRAIWTGSSGDAVQALNRDILNQTAVLNPDLTPGTAPDDSVTATINSLSTQYILPPGFTDVLYAIPDPATSEANRRNYALVKSLEIRHDNIRKHDTAAIAWQAWRRYVANIDFTRDNVTARSGYLVNPGTTSD